MSSRRGLRRPPAALLLGLAALAASGAPARPSPPSVFVGSAWYPEGESPAQVEKDLSTMRRGGLRMVRIGEFDWRRLEPAEGVYRLDELAGYVAAAAAHGIYAVIGIPTDGPPAWVGRQYPDTVRVNVAGQRMSGGGGRSYSYASPKYRELCRDIASRLAQRFGHDPDVIGWQIGNEPTEDSFDPAAEHDFHAWLRAKYGSLASFNRHEFRPYASWDAIPFPRGPGSPTLFLDYRRFVSSEWESFERNQADAIRRFAEPRQFITTNFGGLGWADRFNRHQVAAPLDLASWDDYIGIEHYDPATNSSTYTNLPRFDPWRNGATHDLVRGWKRRDFWVMEMQPAFVDWAPVCYAVDRGVVRDMIWQAIGHGANGVSFWQWRARPGWIGPYHGSLVGPDTTPRPVFAEVRQAAQEVAAASAALANTTPVSEVAILHDYDSRWAIDYHRQSDQYDQVAVLIGYYRALKERAQTVDIVDPSCDLGRYKVVAAPSLNVITPELAKRLEAYVRGGGRLWLGPRSGMMNGYFELNVPRAPGPLAGTLGGRVEEYYCLAGDVPVAGAWGAGKASIWAEMLSTAAPDAQVELRYGPGDGWLDGRPAAIERKLGKGAICYLGAIVDAPLMREVAAKLCDDAGVAPPALPAPEGVEVCRRVGRDHDVFVVINHADAPVTVPLPAPMSDVIHPATVQSVALPPYGVAVLTRPRSTSLASLAPDL